MNKHFRKVLEVLKTRKEVKALGFSRKELKGVAAKIADKLDLKDEATDDEVNEAIDDAIDSVVPFLQLSQSMVDRRIEDFKRTLNVDDDDDDDDSNDDEPNGDTKPSKKNGKGKNGNGKANENDELMQMLKSMKDEITGMKDDITSIKSGRTQNDRISRLKEIVKDTGNFGERIIKAASRMTFKDEEDFEDYLDEVKDDLERENQDRANKGLEKLGTPPASVPGKTPPATPSEEVLSDDEIKNIAGL